MDPSPHRIRTRSADPSSPPVDHPAPAFDVFLAASTLDRATVGPFLDRSERYTSARGAVHPLAEAAAPVALARRSVRSDALFRARASERSFGDRPVPAKALSGLLGAMVADRTPTDGGDLRTWPSAGGLAAVHAHVVARAVDAPLGGSVHRYLFGDHALAPVGPVPDDPRLRELFTVTGDLPQVLVVLGLLVEETLEKYGERGGRFALMEVGAAAQTLSLRLAEVGLHGYPLGGLLDHEVTELVAATDTGYRPMLALAVGR